MQVKDLRLKARTNWRRRVLALLLLAPMRAPWLRQLWQSRLATRRHGRILLTSSIAALVQESSKPLSTPPLSRRGTQEQLDELYACSKAGPVPDGFMQGSVIFA